MKDPMKFLPVQETTLEECLCSDIMMSSPWENHDFLNWIRTGRTDNKRSNKGCSNKKLHYSLASWDDAVVWSKVHARVDESCSDGSS